MMSDCGNHDTELYCLLTSGFEIYIKNICLMKCIFESSKNIYIW